MEFKDKVKLAVARENIQYRMKNLNKELAMLQRQEADLIQKLEAEHLNDLLNQFVSEATWNRLCNVNIRTFADALTLDAFHMPPGIGKKTREELEAALTLRGLRIPDDHDRR